MEVAADRRERRPQFVGGVGDELPQRASDRARTAREASTLRDHGVERTARLVSSAVVAGNDRLRSASPRAIASARSVSVSIGRVVRRIHHHATPARADAGDKRDQQKPPGEVVDQAMEVVDRCADDETSLAAEVGGGDAVVRAVGAPGVGDPAVAGQVGEPQSGGASGSPREPVIERTVVPWVPRRRRRTRRRPTASPEAGGVADALVAMSARSASRRASTRSRSGVLRGPDRDVADDGEGHQRGQDDAGGQLRAQVHVTPREASGGAERVADPADRVDERRGAGAVELPAQRAHVGLDDVGVAVGVVGPDAVEDLLLRHDLPALSRRYRSRLNSVGDRSTATIRPRRTSWRSSSSSTSAQRSGPSPAGRPDRCSTARMRATSSSSTNGLVT